MGGWVSFLLGLKGVHVCQISILHLLSLRRRRARSLLFSSLCVYMWKGINTMASMCVPSLNVCVCVCVCVMFARGMVCVCVCERE